MDTRAKVALAIVVTAVVAYSIGYQKATSRTIQDLGNATAKEALIYLATQDAIRHKFR